MKKTASIAVSLLLVGLGTAACGKDGAGDNGAGDGGAGAPTSATVADFCNTLKGFGDPSDKSKLQDHVGALKATGTPAGIPADARKGFEYMVDNAKKLDDSPDDMTEEQAKQAFGEDVYNQVLAFFQYYATTCLASGAPSGSPS